MELQLLKTLIEKSGLNQREFCKKCEIDETILSKWLKGIRNPKFSAIVKMVDKLGYKIMIEVI